MLLFQNARKTRNTLFLNNFLLSFIVTNAIFSFFKSSLYSANPHTGTINKNNESATNSIPAKLKSASPSPEKWEPMTGRTIPCLNQHQFSIKDAQQFKLESVKDELRQCFNSQDIWANSELRASDNLPNTGPDSEQMLSAETVLMSAVFAADLTRSTYVINGEIISEPGSKPSIALEKLKNALTSDGKLDSQGLYAISKFANQSVLAGPTILMNESMTNHFSRQFVARDLNNVLRYDITIEKNGDITIHATHTRHINKIAEDTDRETWIRLGPGSKSICRTEIHLNRAAINHIKEAIDDKESTALDQCRSGYDIFLETPTSYIDALTAMDAGSRWNLFFSYSNQAKLADNQSNACFFSAPAAASVNTQLDQLRANTNKLIRTEDIRTEDIRTEDIRTEDKLLAKDIFIILLTHLIGDKINEIDQIASELKQDNQPLTVALVEKVAAYVMATTSNLGQSQI